MNLLEALKTHQPLRRPTPKFLGKSGNNWTYPQNIWSQFLDSGSDYQSYFGNPPYWLSKEDILAEDWEIRKHE